MKTVKLQSISTFYILQFGLAVSIIVAIILTTGVLIQEPFTFKVIFMSVFLNGLMFFMAFLIWKFNTSMTIFDSKLVINRHLFGFTKKEEIQFDKIVATNKGFWGLYLKLKNNTVYGPIMYLDDDQNFFKTDYLLQPVLRSKQVIENLKNFIDLKISKFEK